MSMVSSRTLGVVVIACVVYNLLVVLAMHVLEPGFSPVKVPMSAYVLGAYGALMTTAYFVWCVALLSMGYGLATTLPRTRVTSAAFLLTLIAAAAFVLAGIFPIEFPGPPRTLPGRLHLLGGLLGFPSMAVGIFLFSLGLHCAQGGQRVNQESLLDHDNLSDGQDWTRVSKPALLLSTGLVGTFILGIGSMMILGYAAYLQRLFVALLSAWMIMMGLHLTRAKPMSVTNSANTLAG